MPRQPTLPPLESLTDLVDDLVAVGPGCHHDDGQRRRGQDHRRRRHRHRTGPPRPAVHLSTTDPAAHVAAAAGDTARLAGQPDRPASRDQGLRGARHGHRRQGPRRRRPGHAGGRPALALHRGDRRVPGLCPHRGPGQDALRGAGHRADRPHPPAARRDGGLPPRDRAHLQRPAGGSAAAPAAAARRRFTRVLVVTLPEATPVHEAAALQADLRRAQIEPFAWVINQSFAESGSHDPLLVARGARRTALHPRSRRERIPRARPSCRGSPKNRSARTSCANCCRTQTSNQCHLDPRIVGIEQHRITMETITATARCAKRLNFFERYLSLWVLVCMVVGRGAWQSCCRTSSPP